MTQHREHMLGDRAAILHTGKAMAAATGSFADVSAAAHLPAAAAARIAEIASAGSAVTAFRIEGVAPSVVERKSVLEKLLAASGTLGTLDEAPSRSLWRGSDLSSMSGDNKGASVQVVVLNLDTHAATTYPAPPGEAPFVAPISHLSWSPDGSMLLVSSGPVQDNEGWELNRLNVTKSAYYLPDGSKETGKRYVQAATSASAGSYFEEGVYLPDGNLFVDRMCCAGEPPKTTSSLLQVVNGSGGLVRAVAIGYLKDAHSSLDAVPGWTLYLSGTDLFVVADGQKAKALTTGYIAAAWVP